MKRYRPESELLEGRLSPGQLLGVTAPDFSLAFGGLLLGGAGRFLIASPVDPLDEIPTTVAPRGKVVLAKSAEFRETWNPTNSPTDRELTRYPAPTAARTDARGLPTTGQGLATPPGLPNTDGFFPHREWGLLDALSSTAPPERVPPPEPPPPRTCSPQVLLDDPFDDLDNWSDLSTAVTWGDPARQHSAVNVQDGVVSLNRDGPDSTVGYTGYDQADQLRTFTALDFPFPAPIDHAHNTI